MRALSFSAILSKLFSVKNLLIFSFTKLASINQQALSLSLSISNQL
jgi:hypothetical protein